MIKLSSPKEREEPTFLGLFLNHNSSHTILLHKPPSSLLESQPSQSRRLVQNQRIPTIRASNHLSIFRNRSQQCQSQHLLNIQHRHHILPLDHISPNPIHNHLNILNPITF
uniref:Uncharacterized protein n=1 Tax=Opuntia streptacantha TaxID=393608 RepID=A0A7C8ZDT6_OPUST